MVHLSALICVLIQINREITIVFIFLLNTRVAINSLLVDHLHIYMEFKKSFKFKF